MRAAEELFKRLHEELERQHRACVWLMEDGLHDDVEYVYHVLYKKPTECDMASVKIKRRGDEISVTYDVSYYICAVYDEEDDGEASGGEEEQCIGEAERIARLTLEEYRRLMTKWSEELGAQIEEELKRDGSVFTLTVRVVAPTARITTS
jgi:hypothetical protein